jgi:hypothetical protein
MTFLQIFLPHPPADAVTPGKSYSIQALNFPEKQKLILGYFQQGRQEDAPQNQSVFRRISYISPCSVGTILLQILR